MCVFVVSHFGIYFLINYEVSVPEASLPDIYDNMWNIGNMQNNICSHSTMDTGT